MSKKPLFWIIIAILVIIAIWAILFYAVYPPSANPSGSATAIHYSCDEGASITAVYGTGNVTLTLPDGRTLTLPGTASAGHYETGSDTNDDIVFVSQGNSAFVTENGTAAYNNCVTADLASSPAEPGSPNANISSTMTFVGPGNTFELDIPSNLQVSGGGTASGQWMQNSTSSGTIAVETTLPPQPGTNFQGATFTVGTSTAPSAVANCLVSPSGNGSTTQVSINGVPFTKIAYGDAGAGNFYNVVSYRTVHNNQCYAVEYVIHSTDILNYPSGTVTQFDQSSVSAILEGMAQSFRFMNS